MLVTLAGAMSTAELGLSLAEMIRRGKVHAICCTGANLEEDVFNLVAHDHYVRIPNYRDLSPERREDAARSALEPRHRHLHPRGRGDPPHREVPCSTSGSERTRRAQRYLPARVHVRAFCGRACSRSTTRSIRRTAGCSPRPSANLPIVRAGLGGLDARQHLRGATASPATSTTSHTVRTRHRVHDGACRLVPDDVAAERLDRLLPDRRRHRRRLPDLRRADAAAGPAAPDTPLWGYFCQISDSTTSYGSYSGAVPNEKITWGKLSASTRRSSSSSPTPRSSPR